MGGSFSSPDKGRQLTHLINEYQEKKCALYDAVVGLYKALDFMNASASSLEQELQTDFDCKDQNQKDSRLEQYRKLAARLLTTSKYAVDHQKNVTKQHLLSLFAFIENAIIEDAKSVDVTFEKLTIENFDDDVKLFESQNCTDALSAKIEKQTEEMKSLTKIIETLKKRETTYVEEEELQHRKIQQLEQQAEYLSKNHEKEIEELKKLKDGLQSQLQQADTDKKGVDKLKKTLQSVHTKYSDEISFYKKETGTMKERNESLNTEKENIERQLREEIMKREKIQSVEQQAKEHSNALQKEIVELKKLKDGLQCQLQQAHADKKEHDTLTKTLQSIQDSLDATLKSMSEDHRNNILKYDKERSEMKEKIDSLNTEKEESERKLREEIVQREKMQMVVQQAKDQSNALQKNLDEITTLKNSLQSQLQQANADKKELGTVTSTLQSMQDSLNTNLKSVDEKHRNKIANYKKEISVMKQRLESLNKEKEEIGRQLREETILRKKIQFQEQQAVNQLDDLQKEMDDTKAKHEEVLRQLEDFRRENEGLNHTNKQLEDNLKKEKRNTEDISKKCHDLQTIHSKLEQENRDKQTRVNELTEKYMESKDSYETYRTNHDKLKQNFKELEKQMHDLRREKVDILKQVQTLQENVDSLQQEKEMQLRLNEELNTSIKGYEYEIKRLNTNLQDENDKKRQVQELCRSLESELQKKGQQMEDQKSQYKLLQKEIDRQKTEHKRFTKEKEECIRNLHIENNKLNEKISRLNENISVEKKSLQNLEQVVKAKETENTRLSTQLKLMSDKLMKIQLEYSAMKEELELIKSKKTVPVQLYTQKPSEMTENVEKTIKDLLQKEFVSDRLELEFWKCSRISDFHPNYPLLVICVTVSRIGTDVANAIHGISLSPNMAVMVFHHKDEHALPNQLSERILTGKELKDIGGIFDMAYFPGKGIYPCEMNRNSADSLVTFIKRVAKNIYQ